MRKVYQWTLKQNSASIIIQDKGGNRVRYNFTGGSVIQGDQPTFVTSNEYYQNLLENSDYFKKRIVKVKQVIDTKKEDRKNLIPNPDVVSARLAIEFVADQFGKQATNKAMAIEIAERNGYYFPNLK